MDGNLEQDPLSAIIKYFESGEFSYFATTVMPGPQLSQAIRFSKIVKETFPEIINIWGGYFASNQYKTVIESDWVDFVIIGPGDFAFPQLLKSLEQKKDLNLIENLVFITDGKTNKNVSAPLYNQDTLPDLPYSKLNSFYPLEKYLGKTFLGSKTIAYHSSMGCPFTCSFCAVVPIYNARWKGKSADMIYKDIKYLKENFGGNAIEFHDNNFFVSEKRTVEFAGLIMREKMQWWGEGRIDTLDKYADESLKLMRDSGCRMIFLGAETGNDALLKKMDKGGTQSREQIMAFAARMKKFDIIPEYSFVLGFPSDTPAEVMENIDQDIQFIKEIKRINPNTEIIIYLYSPVPTEGSELYELVTKAGFRFPTKLEDWLQPSWQNFDLRKNPLTPWLTPGMVDKIRNFETVLNGYYPTVSDIKLSRFQKKTIKAISSWRYNRNFFTLPYEIKALQKFWLRYRQPELEGF